MASFCAKEWPLESHLRTPARREPPEKVQQSERYSISDLSLVRKRLLQGILPRLLMPRLLMPRLPMPREKKILLALTTITIASSPRPSPSCETQIDLRVERGRHDHLLGAAAGSHFRAEPSNRPAQFLVRSSLISISLSLSRSRSRIRSLSLRLGPCSLLGGREARTGGGASTNERPCRGQVGIGRLCLSAWAIVSWRAAALAECCGAGFKRCLCVGIH